MTDEYNREMRVSLRRNGDKIYFLINLIPIGYLTIEEINRLNYWIEQMKISSVYELHLPYFHIEKECREDV